MTQSINDQSYKRTETVKLPDDLIFGRTFSDNMFLMTYDENNGGWSNAQIKKYAELPLSPASMVLHYGQAVFEGLKAYKTDDGRTVLFRVKDHFQRLNNSSKRMCIPLIDIDEAVDALKKLISIDDQWIPTKKGYSLYIRPFIYADDPFLGVRPSNIYRFVIIVGPVGPYYPEGFKPVPILATDEYVRAVRKGIGECKTPGNYAASLLAQMEAKKQGYSQVLWLDGIEHKFIEEVGTMNIFVQFKDEIATPALTGSILPGVTRKSVIQILKDWGYKVSERNISIDEIFEEHKKGNVLEIFGTGTAAVISAVSKLKYKDQELLFSSDNAGELGVKLYEEITNIQYGRIPDRYNWLTEVK